MDNYNLGHGHSTKIAAYLHKEAYERMYEAALLTGNSDTIEDARRKCIHTYEAYLDAVAEQMRETVVNLRPKHKPK